MKKLLEAFQALHELAKFGVIVAVVVVLASMMTCNNDTTMDDYLQDFRNMKDSIRVVLQQNDSLKNVIKQREDSLKKDSIVAAQKTKQIDSLRKSLSKTRKERETLEAYIESLTNVVPDTSHLSRMKDSLITILKVELATANTTIVVLEQRDSVRLSTITTLQKNNADLTLRAETAEQKLQDVLNHPEPPDTDRWFFGLFKKPSRKQVAIVAGAVGFAAGAVAATR